MSRDWRLYLNDAVSFCDQILSYTAGLDRESFEADRLRFDATVHNLELLGEAVKHVPEDVRRTHPDIPWARIMALRNVLVHAYFKVERDVVWDVVANRIAELRKDLATIVEETPADS